MHLSVEAEREERDDQDRLRSIDHRLNGLDTRRRDLISQMRSISTEQKSLYDRRLEIQNQVEKLYDDHGHLGKRLSELRAERDSARKNAENQVIRRRELLLTFTPTDRLRPEQIRREIAELELRQQTQTLKLDEENALIARLRQRMHDLKAAEAQTAVIADHARQRKEAETAVGDARTTVERIAHEFEATRAERDRVMTEIRTALESAGGIVADMRAKGKARADLMTQVDGVGREIADLEREGRDLLQRTRSRREEARKLLHAFARPRERPPADIVATAADARFEELMKRGKVTLA